MRLVGLGGHARLALLPLLLVACAATEATQQAADRATSRLYARAYDEVMDFYIEPTSSRDIALAALRRLSTIDPALVVAAEGDDIVLRSNDAIIARLPQPEARDAQGWGELTAGVVATAERHSQAVFDVPQERRDKTLFAGMTATLDRFSRYSSPEQAREEHATREGFEGIGITLDYAGDEVRVSAVVPGGPADAAGVRIDDRIVAIDGASTGELSREEVVRRLRGPAGSSVDIVLRRGDEPADQRKTVARAYIVVPTVTARRDGAIAILRISSFNEHTTEMLRDEFVKLRKGAHGGLRGVILDLRGNPGGLLDQAVSVADSFLPGGRIVATAGRNPGSNQSFDGHHGDMTGGLPMAVLVNGGSASSAEIVAAALQDSGRAVAVGSSSYGKGTVQMVLRLPNEGELILTWARLITPAGYILHEHGVVPSVCTSGAGDDDDAVAAILRRSTTADARPIKPRASLDNAAWTQLRSRCPGETKDHEVETRTAERLLASATLYAHLTHVELPTVAARGTLSRAMQ